MLGTIVILLVFPLLLWLIGEVMARWSRSPFVWGLFGFDLERDRRAPEPTQQGEAEGKRRQRIVRQPDLPPRLSLHERERRRIVLDPEPENDDELEA